MAKRADFYPPRPSPIALRAAYAVLPLALRVICGVSRVQVPAEDIERLDRATRQSCIIAPNHPSRVEPMIVAELARRLGRSFYFVSARENFELFGGHILQELGAYSIARGLPDRPSLAMTRALLAEKDKPVVLFPEGEVYHHNDLMLPLNPGVAQIGFWALADIGKLGKEPHLEIVPIAVKYRFLGDTTASISRRLRRLEKAVGIPEPQVDWRVCVHTIGERIVGTLEKRYNLRTEGALPERIDSLKQCILRRGFAALGLELRPGSMPEQMRTLFNAVRELQVDEPRSEYEEKIAAQRVRQAQAVLDDLQRFGDSILTSGHYVDDHPTYERLGDLLGRMEDEVFGHHARYPLRVALVRVGEPVRLQEFAGDYAKDKRAAVALATEQVAARIAGLLEALAPEGNPLPERLWPKAEPEAATQDGQPAQPTGV